MCSNRTNGFTLIEMVMAIVIISVGLAGVLSAYQVAVKSSANPLIYKKMLSIAEEMMEEVLLKPYAVASGTISGCNRASADDISDYASYTDQAICDIDGVAVAGLSNFTISVAVDAGASLGSIVTDVKKITVTVKYGTSENFSITGWRTNYAL